MRWLTGIFDPAARQSTPSTTLRRVQRIARGAQIIATMNQLIQQDCAILEEHYRKRRTGVRGKESIRGLGRLASLAEANYRLGGGLGWDDRVEDEQL